jgi:hypothetical protein
MRTVHNMAGKRVFVVGPPPQVPEESPSRGSLRALLAGVPIHRDDARALGLALDEVEAQGRSILADLALAVVGVEVVLAEVKDARQRLPRR